MVHEQLSSFFHGFRRDAHPMAIMCGVVGALFKRVLCDSMRHSTVNTADGRLLCGSRQMPTIAAMAFKYSQGQPFIYPQNSLGYAENFLGMTRAEPARR